MPIVETSSTAANVISGSADIAAAAAGTFAAGSSIPATVTGAIPMAGEAASLAFTLPPALVSFGASVFQFGATILEKAADSLVLLGSQ